jgi:hypothetical protein
MSITMRQALERILARAKEPDLPPGNTVGVDALAEARGRAIAHMALLAKEALDAHSSFAEIVPAGFAPRSALTWLNAPGRGLGASVTTSLTKRGMADTVPFYLLPDPQSARAKTELETETETENLPMASVALAPAGDGTRLASAADQLHREAETPAAAAARRKLSDRQREMLARCPDAWTAMPSGIGCTNRTLAALEKLGLVETQINAAYRHRLHGGWEWRRSRESAA